MDRTDLVYIEEREKFQDFLRSDEVLLGTIPVCARHLVLHLIHSSRRSGDADAAGLMEAHRLRTKRRKPTTREHSDKKRSSTHQSEA